MNQLVLTLFCAVTFGFSAQNILSHQDNFDSGANVVDAIATPDGGFILFFNNEAGLNQGEITAPIRGNTCFLAVKFSSSYEQEWQESYGGDGDDRLASVITTTDGYLVLASSNSDISENKTSPAIGSNHVWLLKFDFSGNILWQKSFGGNNVDYGKKIHATTDGFLLLCGSNSQQSYDKTEDSYGGIDYWVIKVNNQGDLIWDKTLGSPNPDIPSDLGQFENGTILVSGECYIGSPGGLKSQPNYGFVDFWMMGLNPNDGTLIWEKTIGGNEEDFAPMVAVAGTTALVVSESSYSDISGIRTVERKGNFDCWAVHINELGEVLNQNSFGGNLNDSAKKISIKNEVVYLTLASSSNVSGNKTENSRGGLDFWVLRLDQTGQLLSQKTIGGSEHDSPDGGLIFLQNNNVLAIGYSNSAISGDRTLSNLNNFDTWLVELDAITLNVVSQQPSGFLVFPNPIREKLTVHLSEHDVPLTIDIMDASGKRITAESNIQLLNGQIQLDLADLSSGIYFLQIHTNSGNQTVRVVKE